MNSRARHGILSLFTVAGIRSGAPLSCRVLWTVWSVVNLAAFVAALLLPLIELRQLFVFKHEVVLIQVPLVLLRNDEVFLALVVLLFGIVLPLAKALLYCVAATSPRMIDWLGRFVPLSFFDVFMIALLIFVAKGAIGTDATTAIGLYPLLFFAISAKAIDILLRPRLIAALTARDGAAAAPLMSRVASSPGDRSAG